MHKLKMQYILFPMSKHCPIYGIRTEGKYLGESMKNIELVQ